MALRSCLDLTVQFCYAPFLPALRCKIAHLALLDSAFCALISQKMSYNKF